MELNADFRQRVALHTDRIDWIASPTQGVDRRMLDRIGEEVARATSIVRYAPNSNFPSHTHSGGEEFLVLQGVFQDEYGEYPAGWYVRNPPTTSHAPGTEAGCTIFVKLWQFDLADRTSVKIDTNSMTLSVDPNRPGVMCGLLFEDYREIVRIEKWDAGAQIQLDTAGGAELLVLDGSMIEGGTILSTQDWLRLPRSTKLNALAGPEGVRIWVKTGHLSCDFWQKTADHK